MPDDEKTKDDLYFDIGQAWKEAKLEFSTGQAKSKAVATAKLAGKAIFNTGLFTAKLGIEFAKELPYLLEKQREEREKIRAQYEEKTDSQLLQIINSQRFIEANGDEQAIARLILRERHKKNVTPS